MQLFNSPFEYLRWTGIRAPLEVYLLQELCQNSSNICSNVCMKVKDESTTRVEFFAYLLPFKRMQLTGQAVPRIVATLQHCRRRQPVHLYRAQGVTAASRRHGLGQPLDDDQSRRAFAECKMSGYGKEAGARQIEGIVEHQGRLGQSQMSAPERGPKRSLRSRGCK
jgi:hypothetical protein